MEVIAILVEKLEMTQIPNSKGEFEPVTELWAGGNIVSQVKTEAKEGYQSCQVAFGDCREKILNQCELGHLKKKNIPPKKYLREIRDMKGFEVGSNIDLSFFRVGEKIKVSGISKGKGTAGVIKRHGFTRGNMSHGGGPVHRHGGSMAGGRGTNQKIPKGKKMSGRMGHEKVTQKSTIKKIDLEKQIIFISGGVPGPKKGLIILKTIPPFVASENDLINDLISLPENKIEILLPPTYSQPTITEWLERDLKNFTAQDLKNKLNENNYQLIKGVLNSYWKKRHKVVLEKTLEAETFKITHILTRKDKYGKMFVIQDEEELSLLNRPFNFEFSVSQKIAGENIVNKFSTKNNPISIKIIK